MLCGKTSSSRPATAVPPSRRSCGRFTSSESSSSSNTTTWKAQTFSPAPLQFADGSGSPQALAYLCLFQKDANCPNVTGPATCHCHPDPTAPRAPTPRRRARASCASLSTPRRRHGGQDSALQHEPLPALPCPLRSLSPRWQDATKVNLQGGPRQLAAVRQQGRGEELFVDYGAAYWAGRGAPGAVLAAENLDAALKRAVGDRGRRRRGAGTVGRGEVGVFDVDVNHRTRCN
mmetsp:Transcript_7953/g.19030  ORF Transcript_7953/g.19030 Transcript_7953/m.19030 type:complete len:232 (+) Transcript_7953:22-717(+)